LPSCHHCLAQPCHSPHEAPGTAAAAIATPADVTSLPPLGLLLLLWLLVLPPREASVTPAATIPGKTEKPYLVWRLL
jgi:hypothetical protein